MKCQERPSSLTRNTALLGLGASLALAVCGGKSGSPSAPGPTPISSPGSQRSTIDRPDDVAGSQVHVIYVLPRDGLDQSFDTDGTIGGAIQWARNWFAEQTGGRRVRFDTFQGAVDITFLRTNRTDAEYVSMGVRIRDGLVTDLAAAGFTEATKTYAVFFGGGSPRFGSIPCAQGGRPGNMSAVYLACLLERSDIQALVPTHGLSKILGMGAIHEVIHNLGAVPDCAPHQIDGGHSSDDPRDIMVSSLSQQLATFREPGFVPLLDAGRDDYYAHANRGCVDIAGSTVLEGGT